MAKANIVMRDYYMAIINSLQNGQLAEGTIYEGFFKRKSRKAVDLIGKKVFGINDLFKAIDKEYSRKKLKKLIKKKTLLKIDFITMSVLSDDSLIDGLSELYEIIVFSELKKKKKQKKIKKQIKIVSKILDKILIKYKKDKNLRHLIESGVLNEMNMVETVSTIREETGQSKTITHEQILDLYSESEKGSYKADL